MRRLIVVMILNMFAMNSTHAQKLPDFVQPRLDSLRKVVKQDLADYRTYDRNTNKSLTLPDRLNDFFTYWYERPLLDSLINNHGVNLSVGMIYDDEMRDRIVQLICNEFRPDELDTLVNIQIRRIYIPNYERKAMDMCKFDTMQIFKSTVDIFYTELKNKNPEDSLIIKYDYIEKNELRHNVFKFLQLDTTVVFKQTFNEIIKEEKNRIREDVLTNTYSYYNGIGWLSELCSYINDKRFVRPLVKLLSNDSLEDHQRERVLTALVRMRVEPYYSDYVKKRTMTTKQIMDENWLGFSIDDFVYVLGTQEAFLELSKYLLSNKPYTIISDDSDVESYKSIYPVSDSAFVLIKYNILNKELQRIIEPYNDNNAEAYYKPVYDWMQENYGKYKIRIIW